MLDLSTIQQIRDAKHWTSEINQLYHPTGVFSQDGEDLVYSRDNLNSTKFVPVLLKEWFYLVRKDGYLVIDYKPNDQLDWQKLEDMMWWLWKGQYKIIFHGAIDSSGADNLRENNLKQFIEYYESYSNNNLDKKTLLPSPSPTETNPNTKHGYLRFVCKKILPTKIDGDIIDKWTFGIITNGKRLEWIEEIIKSIRKQKIPTYEIIVCGSYFNRNESDFKYLPFNQRDDRGWITKKKNLIAMEAAHENLCIIHDRLYFEDDWYEGMKKWGNCFDHLGCRQMFDNQRAVDWILQEKLVGSQFGFASLLDYRDWDRDVFQGGQLYIIKKNCLKEVLFDETLYWGNTEDLDISNRLRDAGHILRFNPYSKIKVLLYKFGDLPRVPYDQLKLLKRRDGKFLRVVGRKIYKHVWRVPFLGAILRYFAQKIKF